MYGNRRLADRDNPAAVRLELAELLDWLRTATHDPQMNARLLIEGLVEAIEMVADLIPGRAK